VHTVQSSAHASSDRPNRSTDQTMTTSKRVRCSAAAFSMASKPERPSRPLAPLMSMADHISYRTALECAHFGVSSDGQEAAQKCNKKGGQFRSHNHGSKRTQSSKKPAPLKVEQSAHLRGHYFLCNVDWTSRDERDYGSRLAAVFVSRGNEP
jgi:hypothetical protein